MQTMANTVQRRGWVNANFGALYFAPGAVSKRTLTSAAKNARFATLHGDMIPRATAPQDGLLLDPVGTGYLTLVENTEGARSDQLVAPTDRPIKPKRKATKLRLAQNSHRQLRLAGAQTGRTCQDILFTAMNLYLDELA